MKKIFVILFLRLNEIAILDNQLLPGSVIALPTKLRSICFRPNLLVFITTILRRKVQNWQSRDSNPR